MRQSAFPKWRRETEATETHKKRDRQGPDRVLSDWRLCGVNAVRALMVPVAVDNKVRATLLRHSGLEPESSHGASAP
ncbi:hypothetical protein AGR5A_Lc20017 [Agrobacterium genomosp. 5 str. CFBP 6626]|nr:hypothetical protein AGR5A_Lc20017 [Agrobacterium genomosp. 5 str. CFBP 6626]